MGEAPDDPRRAARRALARRHTWSRRAADFAALLGTAGRDGYPTRARQGYPDAP